MRLRDVKKIWEKFNYIPCNVFRVHANENQSRVTFLSHLGCACACGALSVFLSFAVYRQD